MTRLISAATRANTSVQMREPEPDLDPNSDADARLVAGAATALSFGGPA